MTMANDGSGAADSALPQSAGTGQPSQRGSVRRRVLIGIGLVAALGIGIAIGAALGNNSGALATANSQATVLRGQVTSLQGQVASLQSQVSSLQAQAQQATATAQNATATADATASAAYAARNAALSRQQATLKQQEKAVAAEMGQLQASQISGDAVYVVGKDIKAGVYHTNGSGNTGANDCYFATLNSTDTSNIADNNNFDGPETVDVSSAYAFQINGPCTWVQVG
jgi:multidrug efflux pump subunit AcrA (membrane-fusion protein)